MTNEEREQFDHEKKESAAKRRFKLRKGRREGLTPREILMLTLAQKPLLAFKTAYLDYTNDQLSLSEAAAMIRVPGPYFAKMCRRKREGRRTKISERIAQMISQEQQELLQYLEPRTIEVIERLMEKDLLLPSSSAFTSSLWEDLHVLEALKLVTAEKRRGTCWQYTLNVDAGQTA